MPGVLEVNPDHPLLGHMQKLFETSRSDGRLERCVRLVHQMGQVFAGVAPSEPAAFAADIAGLLMEEPGKD
jgi:HSP90 family molecular chaperone